MAEARQVALAARATTLDYPGLRLDQVLARSAAAHPDRVALRAGKLSVTFAELDAAVTRCARQIRELTGGERSVVAVGSILHPDYVIAYYATIRSGNIVLPVHPIVPAVTLKYQFEKSGARLVFLTEQMNVQFSRVAAGMAAQPRIVVFGGGQMLAGEDAGQDAGHRDGFDFDARAYDPDEVAAMHFTSGTTGMAKAAMLSQRNIVVNALQVADAMRIDDESLCIVCYPTYHPMHMNSAVAAAATQVLRPDPDMVTAVKLANQDQATHLISMPAWLIGLANYTGPDDLTLHTVRYLASGGAPLSAALASRLRERAGVPVIQGYGLAETSPLAMLDDPDDPALGSVGRPVADTECRVVNYETRDQVAVGERGEVQLRGPQLMLGYLDNADPAAIGADGWFSTGDVGYLDQEGRLFLVDRIKDVFKHDNETVMPTEIEDLLRSHPAVKDCVVVDRPHEVHGFVAYAYIALRDNQAGQQGTDEIVSWANDQLPYFKHIWEAEAVPSVPRSPSGKVPRRELRSALRAQFASGSKMVTLLNRFTVTGSPEKFEEVFKRTSQFMREQPGFLGHTLVKSLGNPNSYVNIAHWAGAADHIRSVQQRDFMEHVTALAEVASSDPDLYSIVQDVSHDNH